MVRKRGDYYFENITHVNTHVYTVEAKKSGYLVESITLDFSSVGQWDYLLMDQNITLKVDQQGGVDSVSAEGFKAFGGNNLITVVSPRGVVNVYNEAGALVRAFLLKKARLQSMVSMPVFISSTVLRSLFDNR